jgi:GAF domain-containing protein
VQEHVGPALTAGLASVAAAQPDDPVDYLAHWLLKYLAVEEQKKAAAQAEELIQKELEEQDKAMEAIEDKKKSLILQVDQFRSEIEASMTIEAMHDVLIKALRETTGTSNAYVALLEKRDPPEGQAEPEPEAYEPPEVAEGEEPPPPPKTVPITPTFCALKYMRANEANAFLVGKEVLSPAFGTPSLSFASVEARAGVTFGSVMESEPPAIFHDMPMPGSFATAPLLTSETETALAGGVIGLVCIDTVAPAGGVLGAEDEMVLKMLAETAAKTHERLVLEAQARKTEEAEAVTKLFEELVAPEEQVPAEGDDIAALEGKLDAAAASRLAKVKTLLGERMPAEKQGDHGHTMKEVVGLDAAHPTSRCAAAAAALVGGSLDDVAELCSHLHAFEIKVMSEKMVTDAKAAFTPEGSEPVALETPELTFGGKLLLAFLTLAFELSEPAMKLQALKKEEEERKLAEAEAAKAEAEAAAAAEAEAAAAAAPEGGETPAEAPAE